jgi:hypothetical protein
VIPQRLTVGVLEDNPFSLLAVVRGLDLFDGLIACRLCDLALHGISIPACVDSQRSDHAGLVPSAAVEVIAQAWRGRCISVRPWWRLSRCSRRSAGTADGTSLTLTTRTPDVQ